MACAPVLGAGQPLPADGWRTAHIQMDPRVHAARSARGFVHEHLVDVAGEVATTAALLASELVTNAVLHARSQVVELGVCVGSDTLVVAVWDHDHDALPRRSDRPTLDGGHGLDIVEAFADDFGWIAHSGGKTVWFAMHYRRVSDLRERGQPAAARREAR